AIGIGTLIIFIAMVLVAAVAAAVLINTSGFLQQKAMATGKESTEQVASGLLCSGVTGHYVKNKGIDRIVIYITPNAGSAPIDLKQCKLFLMYDGKAVSLNFSKYDTNTVGDFTNGIKDIFNTTVVKWNNADATSFVVVALQDDDKSLLTNAVINKGDLAGVLVNVSAAFGKHVGTRERVSGYLQPEFGAPAVIEFTTPAAFTSDVIELQ
uniref:Flagellin n=2 Tax=Methanocaldococcus villosus TaxID=667126 RepID=A0A8X6EH06_9EURY|nr:Chain A, Archaellin [Methanocaldococcus villosus]7OFQ_C Chain C, Archaellin [Methanocaldococcus villosus]7OFQ_E Chain E, Archaellin [Methanocaldococcus villosus]7OFQ_G Chain G, Archaellin [Methanocaldococcus villosus]7OFQ_I Chain I, Archaellin [Methanocaldococcus villosus]7OFQ_K Chain K, Archaellin [Methanocaldococcus villosus]7OFQ_M Chain M, Archaellin [Methanocaldococcus villosus]7OFQ_O Chain O, Archaellin [Methanocaldococcus villosus]7OFQ_Q Chain Q, Archaellin [Methanocaldococcus vill